MAINFDAQVRLTEALLGLLRASAPSAIVNVASTAGRVARGGTGAYSASKFALVGWSDSLWAEERSHGVHVGLVLPGFIATEGFPQAELLARPLTRRIVSTPEAAAEEPLSAGKMLSDFWYNFRHNLFKPLLLFFYMGFLIPILRVKFDFPYVMYQGLTIYLLIAIGWKGGEELANLPTKTLTNALGFMAVGFCLNFIIGIVAYIALSAMTRMRPIAIRRHCRKPRRSFFLRLMRLNKPDSVMPCGYACGGAIVRFRGA